ncbi:MAG: alkaline phosphatase family protein [Candidatus Dormibacteria bacterium]
MTVSVRATSAATTPAMVQNFGGRLTSASTQLKISPKATTTAGDALVAVIEVRRNAGLTSVTSVNDSSGDFWFRATSAHNGTTGEELWYTANAQSVPTTGKITIATALSGAIAATVVELQGIATSSPLDVSATSSGVSANPSVGPTAATVNPSEIAIGDIGWSGAVSASKASAGYTLLPASQSTVRNEGAGEAAGVQILSATGTQTFADVLSASVAWTGIIATFEAAPPPPTPTPSPTATSTVSPSPTPTGSPIKHVVVLYMENHSFDNVLGDWCFINSRCNGYDVTKPVTLKGGTQRTLQQAPDVIPEVAHSVASQVTGIDGGLMDGWEGVNGCGATSTLAGSIPYGCLTYYAPSQIPNLAALANKFVVSDETFSMADSPSWGGHVYAVAASTDQFTGDNPSTPKPAPTGYVKGPGWGCDSNMVTPWIDPSTKVLHMLPSCIPDTSLGLSNGGAFEPTTAQYVPTIMDRLEGAGLSWRLYTAPSDGGGYIWAVCPSFAECLDTRQAQNMVPLQQVLSDAASGSLQSYSLVLGGAGAYGNLVQHNGMSMAAGDSWIGQVVSAIENGPDWDSTAIFITYDDCGCFYDHVAPGVNPDGTPQGTRMPMVIVSPYAKAGYTDSTTATFASILAYVEQTFGLAPLSANDAAAYPYTNSFDNSQTPLTGISMQRESISAAEQHYIDAHPVSPDDPT